MLICCKALSSFGSQTVISCTSAGSLLGYTQRTDLLLRMLSLMISASLTEYNQSCVVIMQNDLISYVV